MGHTTFFQRVSDGPPIYTIGTQILEANARDLEEAKANKIAGPLLKRLALSQEKIATLASGITSLAEVGPHRFGTSVDRSLVSLTGDGRDGHQLKE
jgi:hypothetical protein